jgi:hypothetical protein
VNVTDVPGQIGEADAAMATVATGTGRISMVMPVLVAVAPLAHWADDVITTVTISLSANVVEMKVGLFVPTLFPFTFHW